MMNENKDYVSQPQENGSVFISEDVIASITAEAIKDIDGVCGLAGNTVADLAGKLGMKNNKGIKLVLKPASVEIECNIIALYGRPVIELAKNVQSAVFSAVESMTGLKVDKVDVNVCAISMGK